jgi:hypothetical protein
MSHSKYPYLSHIIDIHEQYSIENVLQKGSLRGDVGDTQNIFPSAASIQHEARSSTAPLPEPPKDDILSEWEKDFAELKRSNDTPSEDTPL